MIKTLRKLGVENFLILTKNIYQKPTANIIFNDKRISADTGSKVGMTDHPPYSFQSSTGSSNLCNKERKGNKRHLRKDKVKLSYLHMTWSAI